MKQNSSNGVTKRMDSGMGSSIILAREYVTGEEDPVTRYTGRERGEEDLIGTHSFKIGWCTEGEIKVCMSC